MSNTFNNLSMDGPVFRRWARLIHRQSDAKYEDGMIAAIAKGDQLTVVTHNIGNFRQFGIPLLNPFKSSAALGSSADVPLLAQGNGRREEAYGDQRSWG